MSSAGQRTLRAAKQLVRKELREKLAQMTDQQKSEQSLNVTRQLLSLESYRNSNSISLYLSMPTEVATNSILTDIFQNNKRCYVPQYSGDNMSMVRLMNQNDYDNLPVTAWNIKQPADDDIRPCAITENGLDIIIVPGLGFTRHGLRLGRGKGYYDNYFRKYKQKFGKLPLLIGLSFDCQLRDDLPVDEYDVNLDIVLSPSQS